MPYNYTAMFYTFLGKLSKFTKMIPNGYLIFEDESFLDSTVAKMNALRKSGQFCDVRLQVQFNISTTLSDNIGLHLKSFSVHNNMFVLFCFFCSQIHFLKLFDSFFVQVCGHELMAHRAVLACCSPYLFEIFNSDVEPHGVSHVTFEDLDPEAVEILLNYAYTAKLVAHWSLTFVSLESLLHNDHLSSCFQCATQA